MGLPTILRELRLPPLAKGLLSRIPGVLERLPRRGTGGTDDAFYCYAVWIKHLSFLSATGAVKGPADLPETFAELGPGDSLGIGLAAVLSGARRYYALDVTRYSETERNLRILDGLVSLFRARAPVEIEGWPDFRAHLDERAFPSSILTEAHLSATLAEARVEEIRRALRGRPREGDRIEIRYVVPWSELGVVEPETVDLILSHSVLEHVVDPAHTYRACHAWLRPGGRMSHQIDLAAHGVARSWNGYRAYPEALWDLIYGRRPFLINRVPRSEHLKRIEEAGFVLDLELWRRRADGIPRAAHARRWQALSEEDRACAGVFVQARKREA